MNVTSEGLEKSTNLGNLTENHYYVSLHGGENSVLTNGKGNFSDPNGVSKDGNLVGVKSEIAANSNISDVVVKKSSEGELLEKENNNLGSFHGKCDLFDGNWVRDDSKPYYPLGSCPFVDRDFDCHLNGRPDSDYVKWKWKPHGCDIPRYEIDNCFFHHQLKNLLILLLYVCIFM